MKNDLTTAIITAVVGIAASYILVNLLFGNIEDFTISTVDPNLNVDLTEPNSDIFNFRAVNPTVEVYVGQCDEYDERTGICLDEAKNEPNPQEDESKSTSSGDNLEPEFDSEDEDEEKTESEDSKETNTEENT